MGCGKGSFTTELAKRHPERIILAADMLSGRLRKLVSRNIRTNVNNMRVLKAEARMLIARLLPDQALDRIHILCPDPWPKHKHKGNRLMSSEFMMSLRRILKPDGVLHFATDDPRYMNATLENIEKSGLFVQLPDNALSDVSTFKTEFEMDWLAVGRTVPHVAFRPQL